MSLGSLGSVQISITPTDGFNAPVSLSVSGLPSGVSFQFDRSSITPTDGKAANATLTLSSSPATTPTGPYNFALKNGPHNKNQLVILSSIFPLGLAGLFPLWRKSKSMAKQIGIYGGSISLLALVLAMAGCSGASTASSTPTTPVTPGTSMVTVTATSGSIVHTTTLTLTFQ